MLANSVLDIAYAAIESGLSGGATETSPRIEFKDDEDNVLHTLYLSVDMLGSPTDGVGNYNPPYGEITWVGYTMTIGAGISGTPTKAIFYDRDNVALQSETVSTISAGTGRWRFSTTIWTPGLELMFSVAPTYTVANAT